MNPELKALCDKNECDDWFLTRQQLYRSIYQGAEMTHDSSGTECAARRAGDRFITFAAFQIKLFISDLGF